MSSVGPGITPAEPEGKFTPVELAAVKRRSRWKRWIGVAAATLVAVLWLVEPTTQPLVLSNGRAYDVIALNRHTSITINPRTGSRTREDGLKLIYYTGLRDPERVKREVAQVATGVLPIADSLGMALVWIQAARAIGPRFTQITFSRTFRYTRESGGEWRGPK